MFRLPGLVFYQLMIYSSHSSCLTSGVISSRSSMDTLSRGSPQYSQSFTNTIHLFCLFTLLSSEILYFLCFFTYFLPAPASSTGMPTRAETWSMVFRFSVTQHKYSGSSTNINLSQWFPDFRVCQHHPEDLLSHRFLGPTPEFLME